MNRLIALVGVLAVVVLGYMAVTNETSGPDLQDPAQMSEVSTTVEPTLGFIDDERIKNAESEPGNWLSFGRTYEEQRHSPLTQINRESIEGLGLAWYKDMGTNRAQEATPIVVDGIMFFTSSWSRVYAIDAKTGEELWMFDDEPRPHERIWITKNAAGRFPRLLARVARAGGHGAGRLACHGLLHAPKVPGRGRGSLRGKFKAGGKPPVTPVNFLYPFFFQHWSNWSKISS